MENYSQVGTNEIFSIHFSVFIHYEKRIQISYLCFLILFDAILLFKIVIEFYLEDGGPTFVFCVFFFESIKK